MGVEDEEAQRDRGFRARGRRILGRIVNGPRLPKDDWERRSLLHALARLGLGEQVNRALSDPEPVKDRPPVECPFFLRGNIDVYLQFQHLYLAALPAYADGP